MNTRKANKKGTYHQRNYRKQVMCDSSSGMLKTREERERKKGEGEGEGEGERENLAFNNMPNSNTYSAYVNK